MRYLVICFALMACVGDETVTGYATQSQSYTLVEINGKTTSTEATLTFGADGSITGRAPCNRYFTQSTVPYPWFDVGPIGATKMACAALDKESEYFRLLETMTLVEVSGPILLLTNDSGQSLTFEIR